MTDPKPLTQEDGWSDGGCPAGSFERRSFLRGAAAAGVIAAASGSLLGSSDAAHAAAPATAPAAGAVPFFGEHQSGIVTPPKTPQPQAILASFDVTAKNRGELTALFRTLTSRARFLTSGGPAPKSGPQSQGTGLLGNTVVPDGLTVTVGVGASLFDHRFGLADRKPAELVTMHAFAHDHLNPAESNGDVSLQLCANHNDVLLNALRDIQDHTKNAMRLRWSIDGFRPPPRPSGTPRDQLGFHDDVADYYIRKAKNGYNQFVWAHPGRPEPAWTTGGTYQVIRIVQFHLDAWERVPEAEQEKMIGRRKVSGIPLNGGTNEESPVVYDPAGKVIPFNCHIRLANPKTAQVPAVHIWRRSYQYIRAPHIKGQLEAGHAFICYQSNLRTYIDMQTRLENEMLVPFLTPTGGGYFFALAGVADDHDYYARTLLT
jgi:deferrochelatase/peroxidase EfeB